MAEKYRYGEYGYEEQRGHNGGVLRDDGGRPVGYDDEDVFGHEEGHDVRVIDHTC